MFTLRILLLTTCAIAITAVGTNAQSILKDVAGSGCVRASNQCGSISGTFGQALIGNASGAHGQTSLGFWTAAKRSGSVSDQSPSSFTLLGNAPNPFCESTTLTFTLPAPRTVEFRLYARTGALVAARRLEQCPAGQHVLALTAGGLPSGAYGYTLSDGLTVRTGTMTVVR